MPSPLYVGLDLGGTNMRAALVDSEGSLAGGIHKSPTPAADGPDAVMDAMIRLAEQVMDHLEDTTTVRAVGIGSPGPLNTRTGRIIYTPNLPFKNYPVASKMKEATGIPSFLENDANSACWGEFWVGAGKGFSDMVTLTLGTGVGGSIILGGNLHRGVDDTAGHLGHIVVHPGGHPCGCGGRGCLEQYASASAVVRRAHRLMEQNAMGELNGVNIEDITAKDVTEAARGGVEACLQALTEASNALGWALVTIANVVDPQVAVIGGGLAGASDILLEPAEEILRENALSPPKEKMKITTATLGDAAGIIGAAGCARKRLETSP